MRRATSRRAVSWSTFSRWAQRSTRCSGLQVTTTSRSKPCGHAGLENERRLHQGNGVGIAPAHFGHPFLLPANHGGMDDLIQFLNPGSLVGPPKASSPSRARFTLPSGFRISAPK